MLICLPFCAKDGELALKNLEWIRELDPKLPYHCLLSYDNETPQAIVNGMTAIAGIVFQKVTPAWYPRPEKKHWPAAPNWAWQSTARYIEHFFPRESWLFLEADATPIRSGWLQQLDEFHKASGKPFSGHVVDGMGHFNGCAIYPGLVSLFSQDVMRVEETAWDVVLGATVDKAMINRANDIIRHCWNMDEKTGECTNGHGILPTFKSVHEVVRKVDLNASIYHRCKDGSLIHWLREHYKAPHKAFVPDHTGYVDNGNDLRKEAAPAEIQENKPAVIVPTDMGPIANVAPVLGVREKTGEAITHEEKAENPSSVEVSTDPVVASTSASGSESAGSANGQEFRAAPHRGIEWGSDQVAGPKASEAVGSIVESRGPILSGVEASAGTVLVRSDSSQPIPKTEIFIVTYGQPTKRPSNLIVSDFDWLTWCLRGIRRHCTGFTGITLAIPDRDAALLQPIAAEHANSKSGIPLRIKMFVEPPGKGHIAHMAIMANADELLPKDTEFVLHVDADTIFKEAVTPLDYIHDGKPVYVWRTYASLSGMKDGQKVVSDCAQWQAPTEAQLGFPVEQYTMCRLPMCFPISFYKPYRQSIEVVHGKPYWDYMVSGKSSFPPNRLDWTAQGAFAFKVMPERFEWIDVSAGNHLAPRDKCQTYWSHGSVTPEIQKEIESFLK